MWLNIFFVILNAMFVVLNYGVGNYILMALNAFAAGICCACGIVNYYERGITYEQ